MKLLSILLLSLGLSFGSWADEALAYLCVTEASAGVFLDRDSGKWTGTSLSNDQKYIVRERTAEDAFIPGSSKWLIFMFGDGQPFGGCIDSFDENGLLKCKTLLGPLSLQESDLTFHFFQDFRFAGRTDTVAMEANLPSVQVGRCHAL